jgi:hypothetical protein
MDGLCFIKEHCFRGPFNKSFGELWGSDQQLLITEKKKGVRCQQAQPVKVSRRGRSQRKSMGARGGSQKKIHKGEGAEQEGDGK